MVFIIVQAAPHVSRFLTLALQNITSRGRRLYNKRAQEPFEIEAHCNLCQTISRGSRKEQAEGERIYERCRHANKQEKGMLACI